MATHTDPDNGENFFTRKRGKVKAKWIAIPVAVFWVISLVIAVVIGLRHRPHLVPHTAALYGCAGFFVHAYMIGWRSGAVVFRYASLFFAVLFYAVLCFLHADEAGARLLYSGTGLVARPPEPMLFVSVVLNVIGGLLLLVHGFFLGLGSREPTLTEMGVPIVPDDTADDSTADDTVDDTADDQGSPFPPDSGASIATP